MYIEAKDQLKNVLLWYLLLVWLQTFGQAFKIEIYIGITVHFIEDWILQSKVLEMLEVNESHTAPVCGKVLRDVAKDWDISNKVLTIVTDRGRNIVKGVEEHTPFINTNCFAHIMQCGIAAGLKASDVEVFLI